MTAWYSCIPPCSLKEHELVILKVKKLSKKTQSNKLILSFIVLYIDQRLVQNWPPKFDSVQIKKKEKPRRKIKRDDSFVHMKKIDLL